MIGLRDKSPLNTSSSSKQQSKHDQKQLKIKMNDISISNFSTPLLVTLTNKNEQNNIIQNKNLVYDDVTEYRTEQYYRIKLIWQSSHCNTQPTRAKMSKAFKSLLQQNMQKQLKNFEKYFLRSFQQQASVKDMKIPNSLQYLNLSKNQLTYLFERNAKGQAISFIKDLTNLIQLFLSENSIEHLHSCIFTSSARTLKHLDISQNKVKKGLICFSFLSHLETQLRKIQLCIHVIVILNLSQNKLDDVQEFKKLDAKLPFLQILDISQTELDEKYGQKCEEYIKKYFSEKIRIISGKDSKQILKKANETSCSSLSKKSNLTQSGAVKKPILNPNKIFKSLMKDEPIKNCKNEKKQVEITSYSLERYSRQIQQTQNQNENNQVEDKQSNITPSATTIRNKNQHKSTLTDNNQSKIEPSRHQRIQSAYSANQTSQKLDEKNQQLQQQQQHTHLQEFQQQNKLFLSNSRHSSFTLPVVEEQPEFNHVEIIQTKKSIQMLPNDFQHQLHSKQQNEIIQLDNSNSVNTFQTPIRSHVRSPSAPLQDMKWKYQSQNSISSVKYNNYSIDTSPFELPLTQQSLKNKNSFYELNSINLQNNVQQEHQQQLDQNSLICDMREKFNSQLQMQMQTPIDLQRNNQQLQNPEEENLYNYLHHNSFIQNLCQILQTHGIIQPLTSKSQRTHSTEEKINF